MKKFNNEQLKKLIHKSDKDIDYSDIPATADFKGWVRVGNKSLADVVKLSIEQQNLQVKWDKVNNILRAVMILKRKAH